MTNDMIFEMKDIDLHLTKAIPQAWKLKSFHYTNIARPDYGFLYLVSGTVIYTTEAGRLQLSPGDIIYLPKDSHYEAAFLIEEEPVMDFLINFNALDGTFWEALKTPRVIYNDTAGVLRSAFSDVVHAYEKKSEPYMTRASFYSCIHAVISAAQSAEHSTQFSMYQEAAKLLAADYTISIEDIARKLLISHSTFQKQFRYYFSCSPMEYRMQKKIEKAKLLLSTTDTPIKEIAASLSFYDVSNFHKTFTARCGQTPSRYREIALRQTKLF